jgi:hypothetical protein
VAAEEATLVVHQELVRVRLDVDAQVEMKRKLASSVSNVQIQSTGAKAEAYCLLIHADSSLSISLVHIRTLSMFLSPGQPVPLHLDGRPLLAPKRGAHLGVEWQDMIGISIW